jgi:hypothetical protein
VPQPDGPGAGVDSWHDVRADAASGCEPHVRHRVRGNTFDGVGECRGGVGQAALAQPERTDGIPGVCRAFAGIQLTGILQQQLALELLERSRVVAARQVNET